MKKAYYITQTRPTVHNDPFDRLIISQAMIENITVISKDHVFADYDVKLIWDQG